MCNEMNDIRLIWIRSLHLFEIWTELVRGSPAGSRLHAVATLVILALHEAIRYGESRPQSGLYYRHVALARVLPTGEQHDEWRVLKIKRRGNEPARRCAGMVKVIDEYGPCASVLSRYGLAHGHRARESEATWAPASEGSLNLDAGR